MTDDLFPRPLFMTSDFPPAGPPNYQQGMIEGCKTALGVSGNFIFSYFHWGVHYDVDKALNDPVYYQAWKDSYLYCRFEFDKDYE